MMSMRKKKKHSEIVAHEPARWATRSPLFLARDEALRGYQNFGASFPLTTTNLLLHHSRSSLFRNPVNQGH